MASETELQSESIKAAAKAHKITDKLIPNILKLGNGVVLKIKPVPPMLLNAVANSVPAPKVPKVYNPEKDREEENPFHPDYLQELEDRQVKLSLATINLILYACTEIEEIPETVIDVKKDDWIPIVKLAGIDFDPSDEVQRYITWMRCYAISNMNDLLKVQQVPMQLAGITESEVGDVLESFRSGEGRGADSELSTVESGVNGNHVEQLDSRDGG